MFDIYMYDLAVLAGSSVGKKCVFYMHEIFLPCVRFFEFCMMGLNIFENFVRKGASWTCPMPV